MTTTQINPVEIDTQLAEIEAKVSRAQSTIDKLTLRLRSELDTKVYDRRGGTWQLTVNQLFDKANASHHPEVQKVLIGIQAEHQAILVLQDEAKPLDALYNEHRWTRAFLVDNTNGHVHRNRSCSTCFITTSYYWVIDFSGKDEAEIVDAAGERACTVCYPSAPVESLQKLTSIFSPTEKEAQAAKVARAIAKAQRDAKKAAAAITSTDGSPLKVEGRTVATLREARSKLTDEFWYATWYPNHTFSHEGVKVLSEAIAAKEGITADEAIKQAQTRAAKRR